MWIARNYGKDARAGTLRVHSAGTTHVVAGSFMGEAGADAPDRALADLEPPGTGARSTNLSRPSIKVTLACRSAKLPSTRASNRPKRESKHDTSCKTA